MCRWPLGNDWSIVLPGYWYTFHDDDGWGMTFNGQNVWVSTFSVKHKDGSSPQSEEPLEHTAPRPEERTLFELKTTERNHRLTVLATPDVNCEFTYFLQVTRHDGMVAITFAGYDPEWEKEIPAIARSVR